MSVTTLRTFNEHDFVNTGDFCVFLVLMAFRHDFYHKLTIFALKFYGILCLVLLKLVKTALMLWLHGNDSILSAVIFDTCKHTLQT